jgi:ankyrin repeat protein
MAMTDHGLEVTHMPELRPWIDIVCVHGYNSDTDKTWAHPETGKSWIHDEEFVKLIPRQARVMAFSYNGEISANLTAASVAFHADDLLAYVEGALINSTGGPLFFVAHGFGGIIVKKAIQFMSVSASRYPRIERVISGVVYFGTPHTQTNSNALFKAVKSFASLSSSPRPSIELQDEFRSYALVVSHINTQYNESKPPNLFEITIWQSEELKKKENSDSDTEEGPGGPEAPDHDLVFTRECSQFHENANVHVQVDVDCSYMDMPRFASIYDVRFRDFIDEFSIMINSAFRNLERLRVKELPALVPLPPPPPPPPPVLPPAPPISPPPPPPVSPKEDDKPKTRDPLAPSSRSASSRDRSEEQHQVYVRRKEFDDQRAAWDRFLGSLKAWPDTNRGQDLVVAPQTCEWFKDSGAYRDWLSGKPTDTLFVLGEVGQGKTHLARAVANHLRAAVKSRIVVDFFCDPEATDKPPPIWDHLTWALAKERGPLFFNIPSHHRLRTSDSPQLTSNDAVEIWSSFEDAVPPRSIYLVIDGIDQYGQAFVKDFVRCMEKIQVAANKARRASDSGYPPVIKWLIIHRALDFPRDIGAIYPVFSIPPAMTKQDMQTYMKWKGPTFHPTTSRRVTGPNAMDAVRKDIGDVAGIYWPIVRHAVDDVRFLMPSESIRAPSFREEMPSGLGQYYRALLLPILQSVGNDETILRAVMPFLLLRKPFEISRIQDISDAISGVFEGEGNNSTKPRHDISRLVSRHLAKVLSVSEHGYIKLHHHSFGTFLERFYTPGQHNADMAYFCLKYLLRDCFRNFDDKMMIDTPEASELRMQVVPFYYYACRLWASYVARLDKLEPRLEALLRQFLTPGCPQFQTYIRFIPVTVLEADFPERPTPEGAALYQLLSLGAMGFFRHFFPFPPSTLKPERVLTTWEYRVRHALQSVFRPGPVLDNAEETNGLGISGWPNIVMEDDYGDTPLIIAASDGRLELVRYILQWPVDVNTRNFSRCSALFSPFSEPRSSAWLASAPNNAMSHQERVLSVLDELVQHGADPNLCNELGFTSLCEACGVGDVAAVRLLLDAGADMNIGDVVGNNPLSEAILAGDEEVVRELVDSGVFVDMWLPKEDTPLMRCIRTNRLAMFKMLLPVADVNMAFQGRGAIHCAVMSDCLDFLGLLLTRSDLDLELSGGRTALELAVTEENLEAARMLLQAGAYAGFIPSKMEHRPLAEAVKGEHVSMVELLLEYQAPINAYAFGFDEKTALAMAVDCNNLALVELLLAHGADPSVEDGFDVKGPLQIAFGQKKPNKEIIRLLLEAKTPPDINHSAPEGDHVLLRAIFENDVELVELMLRHGVDANLWLETNPVPESGKGSAGPLHLAAKEGFLDMCKLLIEYDGKLLNAQVENNCLFASPLHVACRSNQAEIVRLLLDKGANAEQLSYFFEQSPLLAAVESGELELVDMVLKAAPHMLNVGDYQAVTPIMAACRFGNLDVIQMLLEAGADIHARSRHGGACITYIFEAQEGKSTGKILDLLLKHGQDINGLVSDSGYTVLGEAIHQREFRHVRRLLDKGADPMRSRLYPGCLGGWVNALQIACHAGEDKTIELLLEPQWGLWPFVAQKNSHGASALLMPLSARYKKPGGLYLLLKKSDEQKRLTGHDAFVEVMLQTYITGWTAVDMALNASGVSPGGRAYFDHVIGTELAPLTKISRTWGDHAGIMRHRGVLLLAVPEYKERARVLLSSVVWDRDVVLTDKGIKRSVCTRWRCKICNEPTRETFYLCTHCGSGCCGECVGKQDWNTRHDHEWTMIPFEEGRHLNSEIVQEALDQLVAELLSRPLEGTNGAAAEVTEVTTEALDTQCEQSVACETLQERRLQAGLQLATLHAFNRLAIRRPAWTPYLELSGAVEGLIAPFADLVGEQRRDVERCNLAYEGSASRRSEELRYVSRGLCQRYMDEDLVRTESAMEHIQELFVTGHGEEIGRGRTRRLGGGLPRPRPYRSRSRDRDVSSSSFSSAGWTR